MPYETEHIIRLEALYKLASLIRSELDTLTTLDRTLKTQIQALKARQDADVTAATDDSAVIDARVDAWGNEHSSLGTAIRSSHLRLSEAIDELSACLQKQLQELSEVRIAGLLEEVGAHERRKQEISSEAVARQESDDILQTQIQQLSEASLRMSIMLSEIRRNQ